MRHRFLILGRCAAAIACLFALGGAPAPSASPPGAARIGRLTLAPCEAGAALCGRLLRPLDPTGRHGGRVGVAFALFPHRDRQAPALGTIVGAEGGPGYSSIAAGALYRDLFAPLMDRRDLLLMDYRGAGRSDALDCPRLQAMRSQTVAAIGACGRALGRAAVLYGTGLAADDLAAVLEALAIDRVDLYGDSYGTFFGQVFAARHPERLRSLVLDGAFPVIGEDPFYAASGAAVRRTLDLVCRRAPTCRDLPGRALDRIGRLLDAVRAHPIAGHAHDGTGAVLAVTVDPAAIGTILFDGTEGGLNLRELDAAGRAWLEAGDAAPLLRLVAENQRNEGDALPAGPPSHYSRALSAEVSCLDYPQLYDMTAPPAARRAQAAAAIAAKAATEPGLYAPLTLAEWRRMPLDLNVLEMCEDWPLPAPPYPPAQPIPPDRTFPAVPALVLSGELDVLTTPEEAELVARQLPRAQHLIVGNSFHVDALGDVDDCAAAIVRRFVATLAAGDTACLARVKPLRLPPGFHRRAADLPPATPLPGNAALPGDLATAAAAVQTAGDALARWWLIGSGDDAGLRGGTFAIDQAEGTVTVTLRAVRWTEDLAVSGRLTWDQASGAVRGRLDLAAAGGMRGRLEVRWDDRATDAIATLSGTIGGRAVAATTFAP
jgi:pimeloyl-ACP methyl ester carboxylesterase